MPQLPQLLRSVTVSEHAPAQQTPIGNLPAPGAIATAPATNRTTAAVLAEALSVIAGEREHAGKLRESLASFAGELLESIHFVRQYAGPPLDEGRKSVSFRLRVGSSERTLSSEEAGGIRARIIEGMRGLGYELRV